MEYTLKDLGKELINTFSDQPSFFSSKRIERFVIFSTMLFETHRYMNDHVSTLTPEGWMLIVGGWMVYAGFTIWTSNKTTTQ